MIAPVFGTLIPVSHVKQKHIITMMIPTLHVLPAALHAVLESMKRSHALPHPIGSAADAAMAFSQVAQAVSNVIPVFKEKRKLHLAADRVILSVQHVILERGTTMQIL